MTEPLTGTRPEGRTIGRPRVAILGLAALVALAACGSDDTGSGDDLPPVTADDTVPDSQPPITEPPVTEVPVSEAPTTDQPPATNDEAAGSIGAVNVRLEDVQGVFIEGFEVGLRFETSDGEVIASTLWTDFVTSQGDPDLDAFYDSVLEQAVPAGEVVVLASANVGTGPGPEIPDLDGELRCRLDVDVPADGSVDVVVTFSGDDDCLQLG